MPPLRDGDWCFRHDPTRVEINREQARRAALASHQAADTATMAWAESIRWETPADVQATLRESSALVAAGGLAPLRADTIRKLAEAWLRAYEVAAKRKPAEAAPAFTVLDLARPEIAALRPAQERTEASASEEPA
jgi:hypothetical protein